MLNKVEFTDDELFLVNIALSAALENLKPEDFNTEHWGKLKELNDEFNDRCYLKKEELKERFKDFDEYWTLFDSEDDEKYRSVGTGEIKTQREWINAYTAGEVRDLEDYESSEYAAFRNDVVKNLFIQIEEEE